MEGIDVLLLRRDWTVDDMHDLPDDGLRYECLDGQLLVSPPPVTRHQVAVFALHVQLDAQLASQDWLVVHEQAVRMGTDWRTPDLLVVRAGLTRDLYLYEPADVALAVEVVSHGSHRLDRVVKPAEYADAGIARYWRVETEPRPELFAYDLREGHYAPADPLASLGVTVDVAALAGR